MRLRVSVQVGRRVAGGCADVHCQYVCTRARADRCAPLARLPGAHDSPAPTTPRHLTYPSATNPEIGRKMARALEPMSVALLAHHTAMQTSQLQRMPLGGSLGSKLARWKTLEGSGRQWKTRVALF